jgi:steroid delta-isomerase-like uncharacterized protein
MEMKDFVIRWVEEFFNNHDVDAADKFISQDYVGHFNGLTEPVRGLESMKKMAGEYLKAFPDLHILIEDIIVEDDRVAATYHWTGTHQGDFMGIPATGKCVSVDGMDMVRLKDGKIVEEWNREDNLGLMQQLGAVPAHAEMTT